MSFAHRFHRWNVKLISPEEIFALGSLPVAISLFIENMTKSKAPQSDSIKNLNRFSLIYRLAAAAASASFILLIRKIDGCTACIFSLAGVAGYYLFENFCREVKNEITNTLSKVNPLPSEMPKERVCPAESFTNEAEALVTAIENIKDLIAEMIKKQREQREQAIDESKKAFYELINKQSDEHREKMLELAGLCETLKKKKSSSFSTDESEAYKH